MSQQGEEPIQEGGVEETALPVQWARGGLAGRVTGSGDGEA